MSLEENVLKIVKENWLPVLFVLACGWLVMPKKLSAFNLPLRKRKPEDSEKIILARKKAWQDIRDSKK